MFFALDQRLVNYGSWAEYGQLSISVSGVLLGTQPRPFHTYCPWLLSAYNSSTEELQEQQGLEQLLPGLHESLLLLSYSEGLVRKKLKRHKVTITDKTNTVLFRMETK